MCEQQFVTYLDHYLSPKRKQKGLFCTRKCANQYQREMAWETFLSHIAPPNERGCRLWTGGVQNSYGRVTYLRRSWTAHRLLWERANGPIPQGKIILHDCDERLCCELSHLRVGTHRQNMQDASTRGRLASGKHHWNYKASLHE
jgi:hypothetical protein